MISFVNPTIVTTLMKPNYIAMLVYKPKQHSKQYTGLKYVIYIVLRPYLFAVYLDELSIQLGSATVECTMRNMDVNHLMFGDDVCLFSPSISGLQCLLNICGDYAAEHKITFNCNKTISVLFCPKKYKQLVPSNVFLNGTCTIF